MTGNTLSINSQVQIARSVYKHFPSYRGFEGTIVGESSDHKKWLVKWPLVDEPEFFYKSYLVRAKTTERAKFPAYRVAASEMYPHPSKGGKRRREGTVVQERGGLIRVKWDGVTVTEWLDRKFTTLIKPTRQAS